MHGLQVVNTNCGVSASISPYVGQRRVRRAFFIAPLNGTYTSVVPKVGAAAKYMIDTLPCCTCI